MKRVRRAALSAALAALLTSVLPLSAQGQQPQWRPSRIPDNAHAQPLHSAVHAAQAVHAAPTSQAAWAQSAPQVNSQAAFDSPPTAAPQPVAQQTGTHGEQLGPAVVLRWKTVSPSAASEQAVADATRLRHQAAQEFAQAGQPQSAPDQNHRPHATLTAQMRDSSNPLRSQVRQAAYQQSNANSGADFGTGQLAPPALPPRGSPMPNLPENDAWSAPDFGSPQEIPHSVQPTLPNRQLPGSNADPLQTPELPPPPSVGGAVQPEVIRPAPVQPTNPQPGLGGGNDSGSILEGNRPDNPFPPRGDSNSPSDLDAGPALIPPQRGSSEQLQPRQDDSDSNALKRRIEKSSSGYCNEMRARIHATPLSEVSLDISPKYGAGFRATKDPEQQRLDFASSAIVREWTDYRGQTLATGRLIDLRDDRVVIDVEGREQLIPLRNLSDVDVTYVGESWNIPERCGTGYDPLRGRNFVPSTVQWAASGLCHKPLYFEQVQLERYGHETGPVLQPLISTAHFFGNIAVLPYKMGIHPPNECQYALGYFRPGNCAPYMLQPIPWSLRGAAAQAAVVTGGAALIP